MCLALVRDLYDDKWDIQLYVGIRFKKRCDRQKNNRVLTSSALDIFTKT